MNILVTGYPGWLASRFLDHVEKNDTQFSSIKCLVHKSQYSKVKDKANVECVEGDLLDRESLGKAVEGADIVLHAAGILHVKIKEDFYKVNRDGTKNLLEAAEKAGVKKFIYISSNAAQGFCRGRGYELSESDPCNPESHYGKSKYEAEEFVRSYQEKGSLETIILRPAMFYGPPVPERHLAIYKKIKRGYFPVFGSGNYLRSITYIDNLVDAIHLAIKKEEAVGNTYYITDREIPTLNEIINTIANAMGKNVVIIHLPKWMAFLAGKLDKIITALGFYWMLPHIVSESCKNIACRTEKAEKELGYNPKVSFREGYRETIQWCQDNKLI